MSDGYSKVACPGCGLHIEYPTETKCTSFPCPGCSTSVAIVPREQTEGEIFEKMVVETGLYDPANSLISGKFQAAVQILSQRLEAQQSGKLPKRPVRMGWIKVRANRGKQTVAVPVDLEKPIPEYADYDDYLDQFSRTEQEEAFGKEALHAYRCGHISPARLMKGRRRQLMALAKRVAKEGLCLT